MLEKFCCLVVSGVGEGLRPATKINRYIHNYEM